MGWSVVALLLGLVLGLIYGIRFGWRLATRSVDLMKKAHEQHPELRTMCGQHDAYLDVAEEIERSEDLPPDHTLKRIGSYVRSQIRRLGDEAKGMGCDVSESFVASSGETR